MSRPTRVVTVMDPLEDDISAAALAACDRAIAHLSGLRDMRAATPPTLVGLLDLEEMGGGATAALAELFHRYGGRFSGSPGPRYWGFVNGGVTPAALAGDWICSAIDQNSQLNGDGAAVHIEDEALRMLRQLLGLSDAFTGVFVTGGTMANYTALATALQGLGRRRGVDVSQDGVAGLGRVHIVSGASHSSIGKSAGMLGLGRAAVATVASLPGREAVDLNALEQHLRLVPPGDCTIVVGNAGTVLTGDFDDLEGIASLARQFGAHFHVDGAFGAFAACSAGHQALVRGMQLADSVASDAHKFLNVPYDSGFVFTRALSEQVEAFKNVSTYQSPPASEPRHYIHLSPQNSRRLRALPAWMTLRAYGAAGYRAIVSRCCHFAAELARHLREEPGFEVLADVRYNVVCFQVLDAKGLGSNAFTREFLRHVTADGRVFVSGGEFAGQSCVRLAIVNWSTQATDIQIALDTFRAARLLADAPP